MRTISRGSNGGATRSVEMLRALVRFLLLILCSSLPAIAQEIVLKGRVIDPQGNSLPGATVQLLDHGRVLGEATSGSDGWFQTEVAAAGQFVVRAEALGFGPVEQPITVALSGNTEITLKITQVAARNESDFQ